MTPRERVLRALKGEAVDFVPFTCYTGLLRRGATERKLRNEGLALVDRTTVFSSSSPGITTERVNYEEEGRLFVRETVRTPVGEVSQTWRTGGGYGSSLRCEFPIKEADDYRTVRFMIENVRYAPAWGNWPRAQRLMCDDGVVIANLPYTPLQEMLINLMGAERFAVDLHERPDDFFSLYELLARRRRELHEMAAESPADIFIYGDNVTAEMMGRERFERYCIPFYDGLAAAVHPRGAMVGSHLDGKMRVLLESVARSDLDFVEAMNPSPDGDVSVAEAKGAWKDRTVWMNFPSSLHLAPTKKIAEWLTEMLAETSPSRGIIVGITEDVPEEVWESSMTTILRTLKAEGRMGP